MSNVSVSSRLNAYVDLLSRRGEVLERRAQRVSGLSYSASRDILVDRIARRICQREGIDFSGREGKIPAVKLAFWGARLTRLSTAVRKVSGRDGSRAATRLNSCQTIYDLALKLARIRERIKAQEALQLLSVRLEVESSLANAACKWAQTQGHPELRGKCYMELSSALSSIAKQLGVGGGAVVVSVLTLGALYLTWGSNSSSV